MDDKDLIPTFDWEREHIRDKSEYEVESFFNIKQALFIFLMVCVLVIFALLSDYWHYLAL